MLKTVCGLKLFVSKATGMTEHSLWSLCALKYLQFVMPAQVYCGYRMCCSVDTGNLSEDQSLLPSLCWFNWLPVNTLLGSIKLAVEKRTLFGVEEMVTLTHQLKILLLLACLANLLLTKRTFAKKKSSSSY